MEPWLDKKLDGGSGGLLRGQKGECWEGGFREPAIAWWPGVIAPGQVNRGIASSMDLLPTFLQAANLKPPTDRMLDGISILGTLKNNSPINRDVYFYYRDQLLYAIRYKQYKAHFYTRQGFGIDPPVYHSPPLLFNLHTDPSELHQLNPFDYEEVLKEIDKAVQEHQKTMEYGKDQLLGQDILIAPCCDKAKKCSCSNN